MKIVNSGPKICPKYCTFPLPLYDRVLLFTGIATCYQIFFFIETMDTWDKQLMNNLRNFPSINHIFRWLRMDRKIILIFFSEILTLVNFLVLFCLQIEFKYHFYFWYFFWEKDMWEKSVLIRIGLDNFPYIYMAL